MLSLLALVFLVLAVLHLALHLAGRNVDGPYALLMHAFAVVLAILVLAQHGLPS